MPLVQRRAIEPRSRAAQQRAYDFLRELRETLSWHSGDAVLLAEANVSDDELIDYFGQSDGAATRVLMVFAFRSMSCSTLCSVGPFLRKGH